LEPLRLVDRDDLDGIGPDRWWRIELYRRGYPPPQHLRRAVVVEALLGRDALEDRAQLVQACQPLLSVGAEGDGPTERSLLEEIARRIARSPLEPPRPQL